MNKLPFDGEFLADDDVFEDMENIPEFNDHVGKCASHFIHFVVPRRDQRSIIEQMYEIPDKFGIIEPSLTLTRHAGNKIFIKYTRF